MPVDHKWPQVFSNTSQAIELKFALPAPCLEAK
jgi:hypothetical protein